MDTSTAMLLAVVFVLALNQLVMRVGSLYRSAPLFYGLVVLDIAVGTWLMVNGLPGFDRFPAVRWVLGLLFFLHASQNLSLRQRRARADDARADADRDAAWSAVADRLDEDGPG